MDRHPTIIKLGSTLPELAAQRGDFEDWVLNGMGLKRDDVSILDPPHGDALPAPELVDGVVITGSHAMVTDHAPWSETTALWVRGVVRARVPLLGICYGHQLLAYALGGEVWDNPLGREFGTVDARLSHLAKSDPLFEGFPSRIPVHVSHTQAVRRLPASSRVLLSSERDPHLAFSVDGCAWGLQFHPEFDAEVTRAYIRAFSTTLTEDGQAPQRLLATCRDGPYGGMILRRFARLVAERRRATAEAPR
jgi:GMP synthase (glutamine-hydrolysing)